jgi:hypothetical protein
LIFSLPNDTKGIPMTVEDRLSRLEQQNQRLKRSVLAMSLAVPCMLILLGAAAIKFTDQEGFRVMDAKQIPKGTFFVNPDDGEANLILRAKDGRGMILTSFGITFLDDQGKPRVVLGMPTPDELAAIKKAGAGKAATPSLILYDANGKVSKIIE